MLLFLFHSFMKLAQPDSRYTCLRYDSYRVINYFLHYFDRIFSSLFTNITEIQNQNVFKWNISYHLKRNRWMISHAYGKTIRNLFRIFFYFHPWIWPADQLFRHHTELFQIKLYFSVYIRYFVRMWFNLTR